MGIVVLLLALNYVSVALFAPGQGAARSTIPYNPTFRAAGRGRQRRARSPRRARRSTASSRRRSSTRRRRRREGGQELRDRDPDVRRTPTSSPSCSRTTTSIDRRPSRSTTAAGSLANLILGFGPVILLVAPVRVPRAARAAPAGRWARSARSGARARGASRAASTKVTFDDVAGIDEAKARADRDRRLPQEPGPLPAARRPDPARRAALRAARAPARRCSPRAVAGEAERAVLLDLRVGVRRGDRRHRRLARARPVQAGQGGRAGDHLHRRARRDRPLALAGSVGFGGGNDEREQTLNQILTEMDGFESNDAVIVLGATNRPEILDAALLRPGRFDRRVTVPPPDKDGRRKILEVHTRSLPLGRRRRPRPHRRDHARHGRRRPRQPRQRGGAARRAARPRRRSQLADFTDALEKIVLGAPRGDRALRRGPPPRRPTTSPATRSSACSRPGADPVRKVSIIPRGDGARRDALARPTPTAPTTTRTTCWRRIKVALGGRVAEEIVYGTITTGAESDIQQLTEIARQMVGRWGMSRGDRADRGAPVRRRRARCCRASSEVVRGHAAS